MRKYTFLLMSLFLLFTMQVWSQEMVIEDYSSTGQYLNVTIAGDTLADGTPAYMGGNQRTYILRCGGTYMWNAAITLKAGANISFQSDYGTGDPLMYSDQHLDPKIFWVSNAYLFNLTGDSINLSFKHINMSGYNEGEPSTFADRNVNILRSQTAGGPSVRISADSCIFKSVSGQIVRTEVTAGALLFTNCIIADLGHPRSNFGAGKFIDARNVRVDTILIENCTFVNAYDRIIRHYQAPEGSYIGNFIFNHNTIMSSMSYHGFLSLGRVGGGAAGKFQIRDNLLLDHFALGMDTAVVRQAEFADPTEYDKYGQPRMAWVLTNANDTVQWDIQRNYYGVSDSGQAMLDLGTTPPFVGPIFRSVDQDTIGGDPNDHNYLTRNMNRVLALQSKDTLNTFQKVYFEFAKYPGLQTEMIRWVLNGDLDAKNKPTLNTSSIWIDNGSPDLHRTTIEYLADTLNCDFYCATDLSAASTDGAIIGDKRWSYLGTVGVNEPEAQRPSEFALGQNYPNPFNPSTEIKYTIPTASKVTLKIYNMLGQVVATLVDAKQEANTYVQKFDASKLSSGIYFYQINAGSFSATKKMVLMK